MKPIVALLIVFVQMVCVSPSEQSYTDYDPLTLAGLKLWLKADVGTYTNQTLSVTQTSDGGAVGGWKDQSGQNNNFLQSTDANRPILKTNQINGHSVLRFDSAASQTLTSSFTNTIPKQTPLTVFIVVNVASNAPSVNARFISASAGAIGWGLGQFQGTGCLRAIMWGSKVINGVQPIYSIDKFEVVTYKFDGTSNMTAYVNGGKRDHVASAASNGGDIAYNIASDGEGNYCSCDIAEILVYDTALSDADRSKVENYLLDKFNIIASPYLNVPWYYTIPDYPGQNKVCHPDVCYFANGWNGYRYWMMYTPFPPISVENPSIAVSNDGNNWITPPGLTNPIAGIPAGAEHNCDAEIFMSADGRTMYCVWLAEKSGTGSFDKVYLTSSTDGITWFEPKLLINTTRYGSELSPSVIYDGTQYVMYSCNHTAYNQAIKRRTCATPDGAWSAPSVCNILNVPHLREKHVDVIHVGSTYYMVFMDVDSGINGGLYFGKGTDGVNFTLDPNFRLPAQDLAWDYLPYRACLLPVGDGLDIYFSGSNSNQSVFHISKTHYTLPV